MNSLPCHSKHMEMAELSRCWSLMKQTQLQRCHLVPHFVCSREPFCRSGPNMVLCDEAINKAMTSSGNKFRGHIQEGDRIYAEVEVGARVVEQRFVRCRKTKSGWDRYAINSDVSCEKIVDSMPLGCCSIGNPFSWHAGVRVGEAKNPGLSKNCHRRATALAKAEKKNERPAQTQASHSETGTQTRGMVTVRGSEGFDAEIVDSDWDRGYDRRPTLPKP